MVSRNSSDRIGDTFIAATLDRALALRHELLANSETTAMRLVHGEADGLPGLWVDCWGELLVITRLCPAAVTLGATVSRCLGERFPDWGIYERDHFVDLRRRAARSDAERPSVL